MPFARSYRPLAAAGRFALAAAFSCVASSAAAQRIVPALEIGGSHMRYSDSVSSAAATITPVIRLDWDYATLGAAGTFSQLAGRWSSQGAIGGSLYSPMLGVLVGELATTLGGSAHQDGTRTGQTLGIGRAHLMGHGRGLWAGAGIGTTWDGGTWRIVRVAEAAAWTFVGDGVALATVTPTIVEDSLRYTDAELALRWDFSGADVGMTGGVRSGDRVPSLGESSAWGSVTAALWIAPHVAVVGSAGTYPVDLTQGFPGGRFVSVGLRLGSRSSRRDVRRNDAARSLPGADSRKTADDDGVLAFRLSDIGGGRQAIRVHAPRATTVEVSGDFTSWEPVRLSRATGGWWIATFQMTPGMHEVNVRVNGKRWLAPPGLTTSRDEFDGVVGLFSVPGGDARPR